MANAAPALHNHNDDGADLIRAPRGVGCALAMLIGLIIAGGIYLIAVRGDAIFLDLAAISGIMFCF